MLKTVALASTVLAALACGQARAQDVKYTFSGDASMTLSDGAVEAISGSFVWNTTTDSIVSADVMVTGPDLTLDFPGHFLGSAPIAFGDTAADGSNDLYQIGFVNDLGLGQADPLWTPVTLLRFDNGNTTLSAIAVTGGVGDAEAVATPEPASMALLGAGLFGVAWARRRRVGG